LNNAKLVWFHVRQQYPKHITLEQLTLKELYAQIGAYLETMGMEQQIQRNHINGIHSGHSVFELDEIDLEEKSPVYTEYIDVELVKKELSDFSFNPQKYSKYFKGILTEVVDDTISNVSKRNTMRLEKLSSTLPQLKVQILIVVGHDHLGRENGLLTAYAQNGYNITRMTKQGQFGDCIYSNAEDLKIYQAKCKLKHGKINGLLEELTQLQDYLLSVEVPYTDKMLNTADILTEMISNIYEKDFDMSDHDIDTIKLQFNDLKKESAIEIKRSEELDILSAEINSLIDRLFKVPFVPDVEKLINESGDYSDELQERSGYYTQIEIDKLKVIIKKKSYSVIKLEEKYSEQSHSSPLSRRRPRIW
tara:strand:+ start:32433 stop:33518 length:1086 start_codon:yes stop_codon:yes gene_type:complete